MLHFPYQVKLPDHTKEEGNETESNLKACMCVHTILKCMKINID